MLETVNEEQRGYGERATCQRALTQKRTLGSRFDRRAAYSSERSVELPLRQSARAAPPSGPKLLYLRLRGRERRWELSGVNGR